jgi:prevent-host-death family protein
MLAIGIKALKNHLSEYVRRAAAGEVVLITDRDRVVAELVPPASGRSRHVDDAELAALVKDGVIRPPQIGPGTAPLRFETHLSLKKILKELDADREDR